MPALSPSRHKDQSMGVGHYENFPVGSLLLPRRLRQPVHAVYHFARTADDIADEGNDAPSARLAGLATLAGELDLIAAGEAPTSQMMRQLLDQAIRPYHLPLQPFYDLLSAFSQDVETKRYETFGDLMDYCRRSANPVGRLMLLLYGESDPRNIAMSDGICSALQLINFWQDVAVDWQKDRVYIPQEDLRRFNVSEQQIAEGDTSGLWTALMRHQIDRSRRMLQGGAPLGKVLKGRIGLELRTIVMGGDRILQKLHASGGDVFNQRPVLTPRDWSYMLWRALLG